MIKLIELPEFSDTAWYKEIIEKLSKSSYIDPMNKMLKKLFADISYSKYKNISDFSVASFQDIKDIYEKIIKIPSKDYFYTIKICKDKKGNDRKKKEFNDDWKAYINAYNKLVREKTNLEIVNHLNIKCCPYCNENYVFNRDKHSSAQLDHFYSKDEYPIFAVCLYNLVPTCPACNHIKGTHNIGVSPHDHLLDFDNLRISYKPKSANWINDPREIEIDFKYDEHSEFGQKLKENLSALEIEKAYNNHTDYVQELLKKMEIYNDDTISNILADFPLLFSTDEEVFRIIFGNFTKKSDYLKRPLSKLTHDILDENGFIK